MLLEKLFSTLEKVNVSVAIKVSKKRVKQKAASTGNIILMFFLFFFKLHLSYTDSEDDDSLVLSSKRQSVAAPTVISNRPQRACKQKTVDYRV